MSLSSAVRKGETRFFAELVSRYQDPVYGMALRFVRRRGDAEDIAQEAFLRAYRGLDGFKGDAPLFHVAVPDHLESVRGLAAAQQEDRDVPPWPSTTPPRLRTARVDLEGGLLASRKSARCAEALDGLDEKYRAFSSSSTTRRCPTTRSQPCSTCPMKTVRDAGVQGTEAAEGESSAGRGGRREEVSGLRGWMRRPRRDARHGAGAARVHPPGHGRGVHGVAGGQRPAVRAAAEGVFSSDAGAPPRRHACTGGWPQLHAHRGGAGGEPPHSQRRLLRPWSARAPRQALGHGPSADGAECAHGRGHAVQGALGEQADWRKPRMKCANHPRVESIAECVVCGRQFCAACTVELDHRTWCRDCLSRIVATSGSGTRVHPGWRKLAAGCLSVIPGAGHMFLGLIGKGFVLMGLLIVTLFLTILYSDSTGMYWDHGVSRPDSVRSLPELRGFRLDGHRGCAEKRP